MKILFFIHSLSCGGAERVTVNLANYWVKQGHAVSILTMTDIDQDFYELHSSVERLSLGLEHESPNIFSAVFHNGKRIVALQRVLLSERPDIAIGMMTTTNCLLALVTRKKNKLFSVGSERIHPPAVTLNPFWFYLRRYTYKRLKAIVALTSQSAEWLRKNTSAKCVEVIQNPIPYPIPQRAPYVCPEDFLQKGKKHILSVGRLDPQKGFDRLVNVFSQLAASFPDWNLVILGEGTKRHALKAQINDLNLTSRVILPGLVGNISDWYEKADLYALTSLYEGFPNTLIEAMAHGLPVVSVDCETGPRDIIRNNVDGLLVPQDDLESLKLALARLMADTELRSKLARHAVEVQDRFSIEKIGQKWETLFYTVLTEREY